MATNRSRNYFTRAFDENQKTDERFRELMYNTFDGLYNAMGKKNFLRWINKREISDRIKELVVEGYTEKELKDIPNSVGLYHHGENMERLREGYENQDVSTHETLHFFTDYYFTGKTFPTFINEGLTEYLNRELNEYLDYTYAQNVDFVEILHNIMGDSLIKAYLTGTSEAFSKEFSTYITKDGTVDISALNKFYNSLNRVHNVLHPRTNPETAEEHEKRKADKKDVIENYYPEIRKIVCNIASNSIRKKAHNLEYYKDGKLNTEDIINDICELTNKTVSLLEKNDAFGLRHCSSKEGVELLDSIVKNALTAVLQESHISNDKIENIINKSVAHEQDNGNPITTVKMKRKALLDEISILSGNTPVKDLIDKRLGKKESYMNNGQFNITSFLMDASLILDKMDVEKDLRQVFLDSAILRYVPQDVNRDLVKTMVDKYSKLYVALYQKQQDNNSNVVDSKFVKISNTQFIEKKDNKILFLEYDEKNGTFSEKEMHVDYMDPRIQFSKEIVDKFGGTVEKRTYINRETRKSKYTI